MSHNNMCTRINLNRINCKSPHNIADWENQVHNLAFIRLIFFHIPHAAFQQIYLHIYFCIHKCMHIYILDESFYWPLCINSLPSARGWANELQCTHTHMQFLSFMPKYWFKWVFLGFRQFYHASQRFFANIDTYSIRWGVYGLFFYLRMHLFD